MDKLLIVSIVLLCLAAAAFSFIGGYILASIAKDLKAYKTRFDELSDWYEHSTESKAAADRRKNQKKKTSPSETETERILTDTDINPEIKPDKKPYSFWDDLDALEEEQKRIEEGSGDLNVSDPLDHARHVSERIIELKEESN